MFLDCNEETADVLRHLCPVAHNPREQNVTVTKTETMCKCDTKLEVYDKQNHQDNVST